MKTVQLTEEEAKVLGTVIANVLSDVDDALDCILNRSERKDALASRQILQSIRDKL